MNLLYARGTTRDEIDEQLRAMSDAGFAASSDRTIIDRGSEESLPGLVASGLSQGDVVAVQSPMRLAAKAFDAFEMACAIVEAGGRLRIVQPRLELDASSLPGLIFAGFIQNAVRDARRSGGAKGGRPSKMSAAVEERARREWQEGRISDQEVAVRAGVSVSTLYRMLGPRRR